MEVRKISGHFPNEVLPDTKNILIVEDDADVGLMLVQALAYETPHQPLLAADGHQALQIVKEVRPHLLLLDYRLPDMTGIQLYDRLHADIELVGVPAIIMSIFTQGLRHELEERRLMFLRKPFDLQVFLDAITRAFS